MRRKVGPTPPTMIITLLRNLYISKFCSQKSNTIIVHLYGSAQVKVLLLLIKNFLYLLYHFLFLFFFMFIFNFLHVIY